MFSEKYKVIISDINYGGHMGNERALVAFHQGRIAWLDSIGYSEKNIGDGVGIVQREANVKYLKEVFLGEVLSINIVEVICKRSSFKIRYEIEDSQGVMVISGDTLMVAYDYENKKVVSIPKEFKEKVERSIKGKMK